MIIHMLFETISHAVVKKEEIFLRNQFHAEELVFSIELPNVFM